MLNSGSLAFLVLPSLVDLLSRLTAAKQSGAGLMLSLVLVGSPFRVKYQIAA